MDDRLPVGIWYLLAMGLLQLPYFPKRYYFRLKLLDDDYEVNIFRCAL